MKFIKYFKEGLSPIVYHSTTVYKAVKILQTDKFILTPQIEADFDQIGDKYYSMSFSRIKYGGYARSLGKEGLTTFVIDGRKLNQRYKAQAINYWSSGFIDNSMSIEDKLKSNENEDRLVADEPEIPNATSYILEIHTYIGDYEEGELYNSSVLDGVKKLIELTKLDKIPLYIYNNFSAFKVMDKRKIIDLNPGPDYIQALIDIATNYKSLKDIPKIDYYEDIRYILETLKGCPNCDLYRNPTLNDIKKEILSSRRIVDDRIYVDKLIQIMKRYKVRNVEDLLRKLAQQLSF